MKLVEIIWLDSTMRPGWAVDPIEPHRIVSVGFLFHETPQFLTVTTSSAANGQVCAPLSIPRGCIVSSRELQVKGGKSLITKRKPAKKKVAKKSTR